VEVGGSDADGVAEEVVDVSGICRSAEWLARTPVNQLSDGAPGTPAPLAAGPGVHLCGDPEIAVDGDRVAEHGDHLAVDQVRST